jgi:hypothetical protein
MRFNVDYLAITFHQYGPEDVKGLIHSDLLRLTRWEEESQWEYKPVAASPLWSGRYSAHNGDLTIMQGKRGFVCFTMKSRACEVCQENLEGFIASVHHNAGKHNVTRIDGAWGPVPFDPHFLLDKLRSDELVSTQRKHGAGWVDSPDGRTAVFPPYEHRKDAPRMVRCYDRRGYPRLELELKDADAGDCFARLATTEPAEWSGLFVQYLLRCVDFRVGTHRDTHKRDRADWWAALVGNAQKIKSLMPSVAVEPERTALMKALGMLRRNARQWHAIHEACGPEWMMDVLRKEWDAGRRADQRTIDALKAQAFPKPKPPREEPERHSEWLPI